MIIAKYVADIYLGEMDKHPKIENTCEKSHKLDIEYCVAYFFTEQIDFS